MGVTDAQLIILFAAILFIFITWNVQSMHA